MRFNREPILGPGDGDRELRGPAPVDDLGIGNSGVSVGGVTGGPAQPPISTGGGPLGLPPGWVPGGGEGGPEEQAPYEPPSPPGGGGLGGSGYETTLPGEPPPPIGLEPEPPPSSSTALPLTMPGGGGGSFALPGTRGAIPFQPRNFVESRTMRGGPGVPMTGAPGALGGGDPLAGMLDPTADDDLLAQITQGPGVRS